MEKNLLKNTLLQDLLKSYSTQDSMVLAKEQTNRSMNRIESPEIDPHKYSQLISDKEAKAIQRSKDKSF